MIGKPINDALLRQIEDEIEAHTRRPSMARANENRIVVEVKSYGETIIAEMIEGTRAKAA